MSCGLRQMTKGNSSFLAFYKNKAKRGGGPRFRVQEEGRKLPYRLSFVFALVALVPPPVCQCCCQTWNVRSRMLASSNQRFTESFGYPKPYNITNLGWCLILAVLGVRAGGINGGNFFLFFSRIQGCNVTSYPRQKRQTNFAEVAVNSPLDFAML